MALLSEKERQEYFQILGLNYDKAGVEYIQRTYLRPKDVDGIYGKDTDNLLRHLVYVKQYTKNFEPTEFKCECGGKYCTGYPDYMKPIELQHIQKIRDMYGAPITVTCGLRCKEYNRRCKGSIQNSLHLTGYAIDFYQPGHTVTLAQRKASINDIKKLPNHHYTYGDGINSNGVRVSAPYMGNALHTDTQPGSVGPTPDQSTGLTVDGIAGPATIADAQRYFGTTVDGVISGQNKSLYKYYPSIKSVTFGGNGSPLVIKMQNWAGVKADGIWGKNTSIALQKKLGVTADGIFGPDSVKALQRFLNSQLHPDPPKPGPAPEPPEPTPSDHYLLIDVSEHQSSIDFNQVKNAGVEGVIVRCAGRGYLYGTIYKDTKFLDHIKRASAAGLKVGTYFFTQAINEAEGREEANITLDLIKEAGVQLYYPIAIDTEHVTPDKGEKARHNEISVKARTDAIFGFCDEIAKHGGVPMIYASTSWFNSQLDMSRLPYKIWCAHYYKECQYKGKVEIWQYTSDGSVSGVKGRVDVNHCYIKEASPMPKFDPEPAPQPTPEPQPTPSQHYPGELPTTAELIEATNFGMFLRATIWGEDIAVENKYGYRPYDSKHTECYLCHPELMPDGNKIKLSNCIGWASQFWHHGAGIVAMKCAQNWVNNAKIEKALSMSDADCLAFFRKATGLNDIRVLRNGGKAIPWNRLKRGMICFYFNGKKYEHTYPYVGNKMMIDSGSWSDWNKQIAKRSCENKQPKIAIEYIGGLNFLQMYDRGVAVTKLQKALNWCDEYKLAEDGIFGEGTRAAVIDFQSKHGLTADGLAGTKTFEAIKAVVK